MTFSVPQLTAQQIAQYHVEGYITLDALTSPEEVLQIREIYDDLFDRQVGRENGDQFDLGGSDEDGVKAKLPQILGPSRYAPQLKQMQLYANAQAVAQQLLGSNAKVTGDHAINKPALDGAQTPWHQDEAYWDPKQIYEAMSIWIPLQDVTVENGCMQFIPGSHRLDIVEHQSIGGDTRVHGLEVCDPKLDVSSAVACPIPAGGCTIHSNRTMHYAGANLTDNPRRALIIMASLPSIPYPAQRKFPWNEAKKTARDKRALANTSKA
ncbi:MAG TPA: phytanoyl-CoA dioxygenase family protein [Phycisphaerales bacterium]|nr:phytanoyl-CoA dioxygenase family protein [Phycisphaerales bacterium]HCD32378.1 phytanoyl-CoA dioxygenase family protein [Phycisphaerales bacterium]|tara:strand:+ start:3036 stop:3833 length:798 start_codon:yes stop_codon:yes gene_type:complete